MRQSGFTIVELVVTLIVLGILAVAIVPRMDLLRGWDEVGYRDQVRGALEYARKSAVAARREVRVTIASDGLTVERQRATPEGEGTSGWQALNLPGRNDHLVPAPSGVNLSSSTATLVFDALGRSAGATITVSGAGTVTVEAETGHVH